MAAGHGVVIVCEVHKCVYGCTRACTCMYVCGSDGQKGTSIQTNRNYQTSQCAAHSVARYIHIYVHPNLLPATAGHMLCTPALSTSRTLCEATDAPAPVISTHQKEPILLLLVGYPSRFP